MDDSRPPEAPPERSSLLNEQLRDANEQLVLSSMRAQDLADQAEASRAEAVIANRLKDEFLAVISHELRNPLNAVLGWSRLLAGGQLAPARAAEALASIERNATALARIIDDLLDVSRLIGGNFRIDTQPVDLVAVVHGALDGMRLAAEAKALRLTFTSPVVPGPVAGDAARLQQVVTNLLSNAIKFTPAGGMVEVTLGSSDAHEQIRVADTGRGIEAEFLPHVFDRFSQADPSTTRRQGGIGLGLAIVRALVERHGGTVHAESPGLDQGATFTVRLPTVSDRETPHVEPRDSRAPVRLDGCRVLLVEDDDDGRAVLALILDLAGAQVAAARSVREAVDVLGTMRPDVIVSDIGLPDEDGVALIRHVRAREAEGAGGAIPAIALTGYARPEDRALLLDAGFQIHVHKPVDPVELVASIAALVPHPLRPSQEG